MPSSVSLRVIIEFSASSLLIKDLALGTTPSFSLRGFFLVAIRSTDDHGSCGQDRKNVNQNAHLLEREIPSSK